jgi:superoxide oxidase
MYLTSDGGARVRAQPQTLHVILGLSVLTLTLSRVLDDPGLIANIHQVGGNLLLIVAGCHAAMALSHHFWLRDRSLHRISPF